MFLPSLLVFPVHMDVDVASLRLADANRHPPLRSPLRGMPLGFVTMTGGARIRYGKPGRKAGTDRRSTVGTTVTERIPEGRIGRGAYAQLPPGETFADRHERSRNERKGIAPRLFPTLEAGDDHPSYAHPSHCGKRAVLSNLSVVLKSSYRPSAAATAVRLSRDVICEAVIGWNVRTASSA